MDRTLAATLLCLMLATPAWAGFDEGMAAYNRGDYATALREWRPHWHDVPMIEINRG